jgi:hypothetical protein
MQLEAQKNHDNSIMVAEYIVYEDFLILLRENGQIPRNGFQYSVAFSSATLPSDPVED